MESVGRIRIYSQDVWREGKGCKGITSLSCWIEKVCLVFDQDFLLFAGSFDTGLLKYGGYVSLL